ncbi:hypothetical protein C7I87_31145 [Mesorhizobium sp. SARCC-RB16n]|uniref:hypothetical protein n=1 Tax=Mesorhizobium sp. SARCC-RB16n TaxID=2116687 RepID=UPI00122F5F20|nr:hypothetical protein [Mesorhizobium sp. SARCC-RB16n]KAA3445941.1 hypothetical protein C7I87_31145 [Mesorhizobium sp. SARCC-RB16n]
MSWLTNKRRNVRHRADPGKEGLPPPFPTMSTFLGLAAAMIALWLLAYGLPHLFSAHEQTVPSINTEAGASK